MLESTVITPRVVGEQVGLGPVWVILAVLVFGNAFGFLGLLLAVPTAATLKVLIAEGVHVYRASALYKGEPLRASATVAAPEPVTTRAQRGRRRRK
jgi:predicted PurR-regulated permease PerM